MAKNSWLLSLQIGPNYWNILVIQYRVGIIAYEKRFNGNELIVYSYKK